MPDQFDGDFYVMAATVIPVFYLALTFQATTSRDSVARMFQGGSRFSRLANLEGAILLFGVLFIAEAFGEGFAIYALWAKDGDPFYRNYIFGSLLALVFVVTVIPIGPFFIAIIKLALRQTGLRSEKPPAPTSKENS
jgi:hypothetical protein